MTTPKFGPPPMLLSVEAAATAAGISRTLLYELLSSNAIRSVKVGRRRLIERDSIKRWHQSLTSNEGLRSTVAQQQEVSHVQA
jgi:excisionase family DNA binding protein